MNRKLPLNLVLDHNRIFRLTTSLVTFRGIMEIAKALHHTLVRRPSLFIVRIPKYLSNQLFHDRPVDQENLRNLFAAEVAMQRLFHGADVVKECLLPFLRCI